MEPGAEGPAAGQVPVVPAGDLDGEGSIELLLPDRTFENLGAVRRANSGAQVVWALPLGQRLSTNLTGLTLQNGELAIGAGRVDGVLRVWQPSTIQDPEER